MPEVKLSELPYGEKIDIGGHQFEYKGFEKRKTQFGMQEHFVFQCENPKQERIFEKYKFSKTKIKLTKGKYKWS